MTMDHIRPRSRGSPIEAIILRHEIWLLRYVMGVEHLPVNHCCSLDYGSLLQGRWSKAGCTLEWP